MNRLRTWGLVVAGFAAFTALVLLASLPTGADQVEGVVPDGSRLAARAEVDDAWILLLSDSGRLRIQVAYRGPKGWLDVLLDHQPDDVVAARSVSEGSGPVPAFTAVYGRAPGDTVIVEWADGETDEVAAASDGTYLAARPGVAESVGVTIRSDGATVLELQGP